MWSAAVVGGGAEDEVLPGVAWSVVDDWAPEEEYSTLETRSVSLSLIR